MKEDFIWLAGERLPEMRLVAEGAILRYEGDAMTVPASAEAAIALNDVASALYFLRNEIAALQEAYINPAQ